MPDLISRYLSQVLTIDQIETVTNKSIDGDLNTLTDIPNSSLKQITDKTKLPNDVVYAGLPYTQSLLEHSNILIDGLVDGQILKWNSALGKWTNQTPVTEAAGVITADNLTGTGATIFNNLSSGILYFNRIRSMSPSSLDISNVANEVQLTIPDASTTLKGVVQLNDDGGTETTKAIHGGDTRLTNNRTPTTHASSHKLAGGSDLIKLDELGSPDDNTNLDASITKHGLMQRYPNNTTTFLRGDGNFASIASAGLVRIYDRSFSDVDVVSTSSKTTIYTLTVLANDMGTNGILEVELLLSYLNNTGSSRDLELWVEFGGVIQYQCTTPTITDDSTERPAILHLRIANQDSAAIQNIWGHFIMADATNPTVGIGNIDNDAIQTNSPIAQTSSSNINTAINQNLVVAVKHSVSDANLRIRRRSAYAKLG